MVIVVKAVLLLLKQVIHCIAAGHIGQKPEGVGQHIQQPGIGKRHRRALVLTQLHIVHAGGEIGAANQVQPLLHLVLIDKPGGLRLTLLAVFGGEKYIQIKFVELTLHGDLPDAVRDAVGHHHHPGQRCIGVVRSPVPVFLGPLLVGIGPVVDLILDKFAAVDGAERRAGQKQIVGCGDGQEGLVVGVVGLVLLVLLHIEVVILVLVVHFKELFGIVPPRAEMVFVKDHDVPVGGMYPFVLCLDAAALVGAEIVLKRAETDDGTGQVGVLVAHSVPTDELPALKVLVGHEIFLPRRLDGGLEGQHKHLFQPHSFGQLIGGKGFAEAHFGIPKEFRRTVRCIQLCGTKIGDGLVDGLLLLRAHRKGTGAVLLIDGVGFHRQHRRFQLIYRAAEPFTAHAGDFPAAEHTMYIVVGKAGAILPHGGAAVQDLIGELAVRALGGVLLRHTPVHIFFGVAHFQQAVIIRI